MGKTNRHIRNLVVVVGAVLFLLTLLANSSFVQQKAGAWLAGVVERKTGAHVDVGGLRWHLPSDVVLTNVLLDDLEGDTLAFVRRLAVKVEWMPLVRNRRLFVRNVRLFGPAIRLSADSVGGTPNYQFLLDAFASDSAKETPIPDICVNSIILRDADISYHVKNEPETEGVFNVNHLQVKSLCAQASLKQLSQDSLSLALRNLSFAEQSGLELKDLHFRMVANRQGATVSDFALKMQGTEIFADSLNANYILPAKGDTSRAFVNSLRLRADMPKSRLVLSDLAAVVPALKDARTPILLETSFKAADRQLDIVAFSLRTERRDVDLQLKGKADLRDEKKPHLTGTIARCNVTENGWNILATLLASVDKMAGTTSEGEKLADTGRMTGERLGKTSLKGDFDVSPQSAALDAMLMSDAGEMAVKGSADSEGNVVADAEVSEADLHRLTGLSDLGKLTANAQVKAKADIYKSELFAADFALNIPKAQYKGYTYSPISAEGKYDRGRLKASLGMNDANGAVTADVDWNPSAGKANSSCKVDAEVSNADLHALHLIDSHENTRASFKLKGNVSWKDIESVAGTVEMDDFSLSDEKGAWQVKSLALRSMPDGRRKIFTLRSDNAEGNVSGDFSFAELPEALCRMLSRYEPTLVSALFPEKLQEKAAKPSDNDSNLSLNLQIGNLQGVEKLFGVPLVALRPVEVSGYLFESSDKIDLKMTAPLLQLAEDRYRNVGVELSNNGGPLQIALNLARMSGNNSSIEASAQVKMENDSAALNLRWNTADASLFSGSLALNTAFAKTSENKLALYVNGRPSVMTLNDTEWNLSPFLASVSNERYAVRDFLVSSGEQYLSVDGTVNARENRNNLDSLSIVLKEINLGSLVSMAKLNGLSFGGYATGSANVSGLFSKRPHVAADLDIRSLTFCDASLGDAHAVCGYDENDLLFRVSAVDSSAASSHYLPCTVVYGKASIQNRSLDLTVAADSTNLAFLSGLIPIVMTNVEGRASGNLRIAGPFDALDMEGDLSTGGTSFLLVSTGVRYRFADVIRFRPGAIRFDSVNLTDDYSNGAVLDGAVTHKKMNGWAYDLRIKDNGALGYYVPDTEQSLYYTTIFGDGTVHVYGDEVEGIHVDVDAKTCKNSLFAINMGSQTETDAGFITFRDRDEVEQARQRRQQREAGAEGLQDILRPQLQRRPARKQKENKFAIDIQAHVTPDATLKLVMDASSDDHIRAFGSGNLNILFTGDDITLRGIYTISYGFYSLSIQDIIHKDFEIVNGSTVSFDGDPMQARLDITAQHMVGSVSLRDLTTDASGMENVRVNCLLRIGGTPANPTLAFGLELPQGTEEQKTLLRSYTATEEQMNLQFVYLLTLGRFYTYDYAQAIDGTQGGMVQSLLNSTLSSQINSLVSSFISADEWTFSSTIRQDERAAGFDEDDLLGNMEVQGILEGRLLNNRLLVNGNFGYRDNPMYASNFIGDFDVRYLLVPGSNLWLKGYNKTNDRYFSRTALTQQGIGFLFSHDFDYIVPPRTVAPSDSLKTDSIP